MMLSDDDDTELDIDYTGLDIKPDPLAFIVTYSLILVVTVVVWVVGVDGLVQLWRAL